MVVNVFRLVNARAPRVTQGLFVKKTSTNVILEKIFINVVPTVFVWTGWAGIIVPADKDSIVISTLFHD